MEHKHYKTHVDVWACGCIMGEMFHRAKPVFPRKDRIHQLDVILEIIGMNDDMTPSTNLGNRKWPTLICACGCWCSAILMCVDKKHLPLHPQGPPWTRTLAKLAPRLPRSTSVESPSRKGYPVPFYGSRWQGAWGSCAEVSRPVFQTNDVTLGLCLCLCLHV